MSKNLLKQLDKDELLNLARKKGVKIPESWTKPKIVDTLSTITSQKEVLEMLSKTKRKEIIEEEIRLKRRTIRDIEHERKLRQKIIGYEATLKGGYFEKKVHSRFARQGFTCELNVRSKGMEFDILGYKDEGTIFKKRRWVFIECKNKPKVTMEDFKKFIGNFSMFKQKHQVKDEDVMGYLATSGIFDPLVKSSTRGYTNIKLMRVK